MFPVKSNQRAVSVNTLIARSWLVLVATGFCVGAAIFGLLAFKDFRDSRDRAIASLEANQTKIARRLASEILLPDRGAEKAIVEQLRAEFDLLQVRSTAVSICGSEQQCLLDKGNSYSAQFVNSFLNNEEYLQIAFKTEPLESFFKPREALIALAPMLIIFLVGITLQMRILRTRIADPLSRLQQLAEHEQSPPSSWPIEIRAIAFQLQELFKRRDAEVLAHISRGIIHDIRNYLHSVSVATELARESAHLSPDKREARVSNLITTSSANLKNVTALIDKTLDASNAIEISPAPFQVNDFILEAIELLAPVFNKSSIAVTTAITDENVQYTGDRIQLNRVLVNILQNAVDSIAQAQVSLKRRSIVITCSEAVQNLVLAIEDSGLGIPDSFNLNFSRIKSSKKHGSGLGLFIAQRIVALHGGRIEVDRSHELGGAKFSVILPTANYQHPEVQHV
jgi:signal transduction histidine kinase